MSESTTGKASDGQIAANPLRPETSREAIDLALDWAEGRRSYTNLGPHAPYTPDVIAAMDAQEVVKWTAVAAMYARMDLDHAVAEYNRVD